MTDPTNDVLADLDEDHEKYAGEVMEDPWNDETQTDWDQAAPILDPNDDAEEDQA